MRDGEKSEPITKNILSEVERVYGVAAVDGALLLRSGRRLIKLGHLLHLNRYAETSRLWMEFVSRLMKWISMIITLIVAWPITESS
jgi:hypothetical protein